MEQSKKLKNRFATNVVVQKTEMVSIRILMVFLNQTLDCDLRSMDDLKTGAVYCQVMHRLFPTSIQIHKVKFYTYKKTDFEINFRILGNCMEKLKVNRQLPVGDLISGHNQVEFCNWIYKFFKKNDDGSEYDAKKVRKDSRIGLCRAPESSGFANGGKNAIYKCKSMIFNYSMDTFKYERRNSLDGRMGELPRFKKLEQERPIIQPTQKPKPRKEITNACGFLAESKLVSLPSESEAEVEPSGQKSDLPAKLLTNDNTEKTSKAGHSIFNLFK
ncbi:microtubule-associated protein RP/EB family member 1C [Drosophila eugracilis]|uniref:microtubule-associated protein RP/EB family member 1C n=1 Tax=Drosophila eugracilis TaxID=29029 RepID=UPI001BDA5632|nr:microtubule-associated protein RP/EB family member 1C [Drosophila eugracilis]